MGSYWMHDPDARLDYAFDWTEWLGGDVITSAEVTADPAVVTADPAVINGSRVTAWLSAATPGRCKVSCKVTTAAGRTDERSQILYVTGR